MKKLDYIIVGLGIAGISICEELLKNNKRFIVYDYGEINSTTVAAGMVNPVVLKRFTPVWNADKHIQSALQFYNQLSEKLGVQLYTKIPLWRVFNSIEEQNNWVVASDRNDLKEYLDPKIIKNENPRIQAPFGFGRVYKTGIVNTQVLISKYKEFLKRQSILRNETFQYEALKEDNSGVTYQDYQANRIIFSEGASVIHNPYFPSSQSTVSSHLVIPNKGEYLTIHAPDLQLQSIIKTSIFIIPLGEDLYKVGATYNRNEFSIHATQNAKEYLLQLLNSLIYCDFTIVDQVAGIRPTTKDRKPFLGTLDESEHRVFFNGLGTRGITSAPSLAKALYKHLEDDIPLDREVAIKRYYKW